MAGLGASLFTGEVGFGTPWRCLAAAGWLRGDRRGQARRRSSVIAVDIDPRKLEVALQFGATYTVKLRRAGRRRGHPGLTGGNGADVCIEAVGNSLVMEQAFYARDLAGTLVQVGVPTRRCASTFR